MTRRRPGDKPLSEPMLVSLLTHTCVTRPCWVKCHINLCIVLSTSMIRLYDKAFLYVFLSDSVNSLQENQNMQAAVRHWRRDILCEFKIWSRPILYRADSRFAPSQWETALLCNDVSHWLGAKPRISPDIAVSPHRRDTCRVLMLTIHYHLSIITRNTSKPRISLTFATRWTLPNLDALPTGDFRNLLP